jgi:hypothetical protein
MARLGALLTKAELIELAWAAGVSVLLASGRPIPTTPDADELERLTLLVGLANVMRRQRDPHARPVDASRLGGEGVFLLRRACAEALKHESETA